jgi:predicted RNA binding protein YcfA (HicA-like mRNA interferase family)
VSPKHPAINAKDLIKALKKKGFVFERQTGSHAIYVNSDKIRVTVPIHGKRDLGIGLLRQILNDANISVEELKMLI